MQAAFGTIGGGFENTVTDSGFFGTVAGDTGNSSSGFGDTVGGGGNNSATGGYATVAGGFENVASGGDSAVCGGVLNIAGGAASFAGGQQAQALHDGSFVWNDFSTIGNPFKDSTANQFNVRASGSVRFFLADDYAAGYSLAGGGTGWSCSSDRASKEHFSPVDKEQILQAVARLPIQSWNVKAQGPAVRHIGPTTQDFHDAFRLSAEDKTINRIDADGVALAAIQQMYELLKEQDGKSGPWRRGGGPKTRPSGRSMRACGPSNRS